ncbi:MAG: HD domain-containing phosphohydrolase [Patescibacteria group bacterium]|jgi:HD-GYP domain-containing protein (c-di-GMP phosphodiesterase class II)
MEYAQGVTDLSRDQLRILLEIAGMINTTGDLKGPLSQALRMAIEAIGGEEGSILMLNHDGLLRIYAALGIPEETIRTVNAKGIQLGEGFAGCVAQTNKPLLLNKGNGHSVRIQSAISVPLSVDHRVIGVLNVSRIKSDLPFNELDLAMLVHVARELYPVIGKRRNLEAIYEAAVALAAATSLPETIFAMMVMKQALLVNELALFIVAGEYLEEVTSTTTGPSQVKIPLAGEPATDDTTTAAVIIQSLRGKKMIVCNEVTPGASDQRPFAVIPFFDPRQKPEGAIVIYGEVGCAVTQEETTVIQTFARIVALQISHLQDIADKKQGQQRMVFILAAALEFRSHYTAGHSNRVSTYAVAVGKKLGLRPEELLLLEHGGLIHDIGKIGIRDEVLEKPGQLTVEEWAEMKQHPDRGVAMIKDGGAFSEGVARFILRHHERPDGKGYPNGIGEDQLTTAELILGAVDCFDAMTSRRNYRQEHKDGMPIEAAILEMIRCSGTQFNTQVVQALISALKDGIQIDEDGGSRTMLLGPTECQAIATALLHRSTPDPNPADRQQISSQIATQFATLFPLTTAG